MNEHEAEDALNSAFNALDARRDLHDALRLFIHHGERTTEYFERAFKEQPEYQEGRRVAELLTNELEWSKSLLQLVEDHNRSIEDK